MDEGLEDFGGSAPGASFEVGSFLSETESVFLSSCSLSCAAKGASEIVLSYKGVFPQVLRRLSQECCFFRNHRHLIELCGVAYYRCLLRLFPAFAHMRRDLIRHTVDIGA